MKPSSNCPRGLCCQLLLVGLFIHFSATILVADEPTAAWRTIETIPAAEAFQAAAADGRFFYAIANSQIAKYDRRSKQRIALSQGEAKHLNSGFLWDGRLLCAHSNYPLKPEQSQVKVLDVETMQLTTFHDFADSGGSLTWIVRHDGHWWCNFAHYGRDNGQTFLAKLDDQWRETARWTYPRAVLDELGSYSLSGGIWYDDGLLVTGHDDPVLFRLRVPGEGKVLEFVEKQTVPFSGQGIAQVAGDDDQNVLIGIHRAKRQVIFASRESKTLSPP